MQNQAQTLLPKSKSYSIPTSKQENYALSKKLIWAIIFAGIILRLFHFVDNRSLWTDEIYLANSLIRMDFWELATQPLEYQQKAPIGFLWMAKLAVLLFGKGEMALRLFPLLCGIASLFLFSAVSRYFLKPAGATIAMVMLAFAPPLVFHAVEIKPYSTELLCTTGALFMFIKFHRQFSFLSLFLWGAGGALLLWFSLSSIFILAGIAFGTCLYYLLNKKLLLFVRSILPFSMWLISFAVYYFLFLKEQTGSEWLLDWFERRGAFMPLPPASVTDLKWFAHFFYDIHRYPMGLSWDFFTHESQVLRVLFRMPVLPSLCLLLGFVFLFRKDKKLFLVLSFPLLLSLVASGLKVYPLYERLIVFLAPLLIIIIVFGFSGLAAKLGNKKWQYILTVLLLLGPFWGSARQIINPDYFGDYKRSRQRSAFLFVDEHFREGDIVYVNWNSLHTYRFYKEAYNLKYNAIEGKDARFISKNFREYMQHLQPDIEALDGKKRVWLIYHKRVWLNIGDFDQQPEWYFKEEIAGGGRLLHESFLNLGKEIKTYQTGEFNVSLLDLSTE